MAKKDSPKAANTEDKPQPDTNVKGQEDAAENPELHKPVVSKDDSNGSAGLGGAASTEGKRSWRDFLKTKKGKITLGAGALIVLVSVLLLIPFTRYGILGSFIRKDLSVTVIDSKTGKPVSDAEVSLPGVTGYTDDQGKATLRNVAVGNYQLAIKKKYFKSVEQAITVPILSNADAGQVKIEATGRQVPVTVKNKISGEPLQKVAIKVADTSAITDNAGEATLVVPAESATVKATFTADGFNAQEAEVTVIEQKDSKNDFALTPSGTLYFLSKRTGKINVMKANLDGSDAQVVVAGTGKEEEGGTILLASRDWKFLLLKARRDSEKPKLYLINTSNNQTSVVDEGNADFSLVGWHNHSFVYKVDRLGLKPWQPKATALKTFDADTNKLAVIDETQAEGTGSFDYRREEFSNIYIIDSKGVIVFVKSWSGYANNKPMSIVSLQPSGAGKKVLKAFDANHFINNAVPYKADEIYFAVYNSPEGKYHYYEYEDDAITENTNIKSEDFNQYYPTFLLSPSGQKTFWYEPRDGKNTLLVGDAKGGNGKELASLSEFTPYGWYTDNYLLASQKGSELYIIPAQATDTQKSLKVTDYHKPSIVFRGYGGGYGGGF
ncbi:MAG TPA: carboxypeptidase-like regulatory domain-containing protein [Candidatus Saccharimonadales bacterium]|nr:carboxypeptidase-like regulatory domain-containing protein [Candidatus Saccharimonadales bacterium]